MNFFRNMHAATDEMDLLNKRVISMSNQISGNTTTLLEIMDWKISEFECNYQRLKLLGGQLDGATKALITKEEFQLIDDSLNFLDLKADALDAIKSNIELTLNHNIKNHPSFKKDKRSFLKLSISLKKDLDNYGVIVMGRKRDQRKAIIDLISDFEKIEPSLHLMIQTFEELSKMNLEVENHIQNLFALQYVVNSTISEQVELLKKSFKDSDLMLMNIYRGESVSE